MSLSVNTLRKDVRDREGEGVVGQRVRHEGLRTCKEDPRYGDRA